ncbi:MAG: argininosuccinate lyase, partial [Hydrogenoanaerobacterium sp.]
LVAYCIDSGVTLEALSIAEFKKAHPLFGEDVYDAISLETCIEGRNVLGGPAPKEVERQIAAVRAKLEKIKK